MRPIICYLRVSTAQQGKSGLGIEAQRSAMSAFAKANDFAIFAKHVDMALFQRLP
jgi:DNA invertase Pin-like site-specific DNA recombinase